MLPKSRVAVYKSTSYSCKIYMKEKEKERERERETHSCSLTVKVLIPTGSAEI